MKNRVTARSILDYKAEPCSDLNYCVGKGIMYQRDMSRSITYDSAYFNKYLSYEDTAIAKLLNRFRIDLTEKYSKQDILDIGIGSGEFIKKSNRKVYGFDINLKAVEWLNEHNLYIDPYSGIPENIDCVTFWDSLEHIREPWDLLDRVRNGMYVIVSMPIFDDLWDLRSSRHYRPDEHYYYFTLIGFTDYMGECGFHLVEVSDFETQAGRENITTFVFAKTKN